MLPGFTNYSKWDKLELSDDEDTHPGAKFIEANTLRRIKRESHQVKEQERQEKLKSLEAQQATGVCVCVCICVFCRRLRPLAGLLRCLLKSLRFAHSRARSDDSAFRELEAKVAALSTAGDEDAAGQARTALWALQKAMDARAAEIAKLERERKFNADELCYVSQEKSLVGRCVRVREFCGSTLAEGVTDSSRPHPLLLFCPPVLPASRTP